MSPDILAFTLYTETDWSDGIIFGADGDTLGRVLHKTTPCCDNTMYSYDIESTKETFEKLQNGKIRLYGIEKYSIGHCSTWYTHQG